MVANFRLIMRSSYLNITTLDRGSFEGPLTSSEAPERQHGPQCRLKPAADSGPSSNSGAEVWRFILHSEAVSAPVYTDSIVSRAMGVRSSCRNRLGIHAADIYWSGKNPHVSMHEAKSPVRGHGGWRSLQAVSGTKELFRGRRQDTPLLRRRFGSNLRGSDGSARWSELYVAALVLLIVALCYKMFAAGLLALALLATGVWAGRAHLNKINATFLLTLLYLADATVTAFMVSTGEGVIRTAQFIIVASGLTGAYLYSWNLEKKAFETALVWSALVSAAIIIHVIVYHLFTGRLVVWKYLEDTKLVFSLVLFLCFSLRDQISRYLPFLGVAVVLFFIVLASGERKALLLFVALVAFANVSLRWKAAIFAAGACLVGFIALSGLDDGLLARKVEATSVSYDSVSDRFFMTVENIGDQSDVIREFVNRNAWRLFEEHRWLGLGATGYWSWARETFGAYGGMAMNVHGEINRVPVEGGIVGIVIACAYLIAVGWRTAHFAFLRPARTGSSLERAPFMLFLFVLCYAYAEAFDTALLILIGLCGVVAARLPPPSPHEIVRRSYRPVSRRVRESL